jgi:hypothetical protein
VGCEKVPIHQAAVAGASSSPGFAGAGETQGSSLERENRRNKKKPEPSFELC